MILIPPEDHAILLIEDYGKQGAFDHAWTRIHEEGDATVRARWYEVLTWLERLPARRAHVDWANV